MNQAAIDFSVMPPAMPCFPPQVRFVTRPQLLTRIESLPLGRDIDLL
jgi:hypothetical protein